MNNVVGVWLVTRNCCGQRLRNVEVRAGMNRVPDDKQKPNQDRLTVNTKVATFGGPAHVLSTYRILFDVSLGPVRAKYITLQILGTSYLEINEVAPMITKFK